MRFGSPAVRWLLLALVFGLTGYALADRVTLKDGTVLEGTVIKTPNGYWIKGEDGTRRQLAETDVLKVERGSFPSSGSGPSIGHAGGGTIAPHVGNLASTKQRADEAETPLAAVTIWQQFIDSKPGADDLKSAQDEQAKWKKLQKEGAEKIKGKWVGGEERKAIVEKSRRLHNEGIALFRNNQTVQAVKKLEEAQRVYPNSFPSAFWLGYLSMLQAKGDRAMNEKAINYFNEALRLKPTSPEALANLGLCQIYKRDYQQAVMTLYKAVQNGDTKEIAEDLITAISYLPASQHRTERIKPAMDAASLLASKYGLGGPGQLWIVELDENEKKQPGHHSEDLVPGSAWCGTGFLIDSGGLILTNRHVADNAKTLLVELNDGKEKSAEVVKIDDEQDLALIKIKADGTLPFVKLSPNDSPNDGADCTVLGFPLGDAFGGSVKITRGVVTSKEHLDIGSDVMVDAKVNPGNSGGPIIDRYGNVMAIVSMKSLATEMVDSYGLGISAGQIRRFLAKNNVVVPKGQETGMPMTTEQIAAKVKPATVCILGTR